MVRTRHKITSGVQIADGAAMPRLTACLKTLVSIFPVRRRDRLALTPGHFGIWRRRLANWDAIELINVTAALELAFCGLLRSAEFCPKTTTNWHKAATRLTRAHVEFVPSADAPQLALVFIAKAKGPSSVDQYNDRNPLVLPMDAAAPVNACRALWNLFKVDKVAEEAHSTTPLFRDVRRAAKPPLVYKQMLQALRTLLTFIPDMSPEQYGLHSLRIGGATALLAAGCPPQIIQAMGRWSSDIYRLYCRANLHDMTKWQLALGKQHVTPTETAALLAKHGIPVQGSANWSEEFEQLAEDFTQQTLEDESD